jgi:hypothetical protein
MLWGVEKDVTERFVAAGIAADRIGFERHTFTFITSVSPSDYLATFREYYGPTMNAYAAADSSGRAADLHRELDALFNAQNQSTDGTTRIPATSLLVTVRR